MEAEEIKPILNTPKEEDTFKPTEEEILEFFKLSLAGDKPYTYQYVFGRGKFSAKFKTLTFNESAAIFTQLKMDQEKGRINSDVEYYAAQSNYRLALALVSLNNEVFNPNITNKNSTDHDIGETWVRMKAEPLLHYQSYMLLTLGAKHTAFEQRVDALRKALEDENFPEAN